MTKAIITIFVLSFTITACADTYEPIIDLKGSEKPQTAQEDLMECEWLVERYGPDNWFRHAPDEAMVRRCLEGRGHSVIN